MTQLPSPHRRPGSPHHVRRVRPKTYSVAVYLVVAIVLLQVAMLISVFWLRAMVVSVNVHPPQAGTAGPGGRANGLPGLRPGAPTGPELPNLPRLETTVTRPALLRVPDVSDKLAQITSLNDEAETDVRANDFSTAAEILIKAEDIDPRNPTTLKNMAETYNLMNDEVKSKVYWQRLADLGPGVGTVYAAARDHVLLLDSGHDADTLRAPSTLARMIYVDAVEKTPVETRSGDAQFHVRAVLKRKDTATPFDQKLLQPYVIFYQLMPDGSLVPDLGQRKGAFENTFLFWNDRPREAFGVDYVMPIPGMPGPNNTTQGEYYGFVIGIYYNKELQDERSEPSDLMERMPLPQEIE